jgi:hypothetical protein
MRGPFLRIRPRFGEYPLEWYERVELGGSEGALGALFDCSRALRP